MTRATPQSSTERPTVIRVAATFVAEPVLDTLRMWMDLLGLQVRLETAPYNQVLQELHRLRHAAREEAIVLVLTRPEDWIRFEAGRLPNQATSIDVMSARVRECGAALVDLAAHTPARLVLGLCPDSPAVASQDWAAAVDRLCDELRRSFASHGRVKLITARDVLSAYRVDDVHDTTADAIAHVPYTDAFFAAVGTALSRHVSSVLVPGCKAVSVDCDNTLWCGVCGEDGPAALIVDPAAADLQRLMLQLRDRGVALCLCSKNNEADVRAAFEAVDGMLLKWSDFSARRVNWQPKSTNLKELSAELNIGMDAFVHVDDDPVECAELSRFAGDAVILQLPADRSRIAATLSHLWVLDGGPLTAEDALRHDFYRTNAQRDDTQRSARDVHEFIERLELQVLIQDATDRDMTRITQLLRRTNQFNSAGSRLTQAEAEALCRNGSDRLAVRAQDRFGDYGLVGIAIVNYGDTARVETLALSCRALGRGVESHMLLAIAERAQRRGTRLVEIICRPTERNLPFQNFLRSLPGGQLTCGDGEWLFQGSISAILDHPAPAGWRAIVRDDSPELF